VQKEAGRGEWAVKRYSGRGWDSTGALVMARWERGGTGLRVGRGEMKRAQIKIMRVCEETSGNRVFVEGRAYCDFAFPGKPRERSPVGRVKYDVSGVRIPDIPV
jgi:hypothetical protein